jgi:hypothetical protein
MVDEVALEQIILSVSLVSMPVIILPLFRTYLSPFLDMQHGPHKAAYHMLGFQVLKLFSIT